MSFNSEILRILYYDGLILPHITSGIEIWFDAADTELESVIA